MTIPLALRDVALARDAEEALSLIETRVVQGLESALRMSALDDVVWAVGLRYADDQEEFEPASVHIGLLREQKSALNAKRMDQLYDPVWDLHRWSCESELDPWPSDQPDFAAANELLAQALEDAGVVNPVRWVLARVARAATARAQPVPVTDDFVVVPVDPAAYDEIAHNVGFCAPAATFDNFIGRILITPTTGREDAIAYLQEYANEMITEYLGTFWCTAGGEDGQEDGPFHVSLPEALEWAAGRAARIHLSVGEGEFSAGDLPIEGLPVWPPERQVHRRKLD